MKDRINKIFLLAEPLYDKYKSIADSRYGRLIRMSSYHVYFLLFLPTWCAIWMVDEGQDWLHRSLLSLIFALGAFLTRSAGCIINDIADIKFDRQVERTNGRPLVTGEVRISEAVTLAVIMSGLAFIILMFLPSRVLYVGIVAAIMTVVYPLSKRFTNCPQVILGFTFNLGVVMAWLTLSDSHLFQLAMLYIGFSNLTFGYDTIYACQDIECDKEAGVKSFPLFIQSQGRSVVDAVRQIYRSSFTSLGIAGLGMGMGSSFYLALGAAIYVTFNSLNLCRDEDPQSCSDHFKKISLVLVIIFLGIAFGR
jgi:4-hydroxybenzoate polyprenyltransferase